MKSAGLLILTISALIISNCGYYSFSGALPSHIKTVAIPLFEDRTSEFGVREQLTDAVIEEFTRDNSLRIVDRRSTDSIIEGMILSIEDRAGAYDKDERVQEIKVYITIQVKYEDLKKRKTFWEERITQWGIYDPTQGTEGRKDAIGEAVDKLAADILNKTVSGW